MLEDNEGTEEAQLALQAQQVQEEVGRVSKGKEKGKQAMEVEE